MTLTMHSRTEPAAATSPALLAVSHGTSSPSGQAAVAALVAAVSATRPDLAVREGFVDVQGREADGVMLWRAGDSRPPPVFTPGVGPGTAPA